MCEHRSRMHSFIPDGARNCSSKIPPWTWSLCIFKWRLRRTNVHAELMLLIYSWLAFIFAVQVNIVRKCTIESNVQLTQIWLWQISMSDWRADAQMCLHTIDINKYVCAMCTCTMSLDIQHVNGLFNQFCAQISEQTSILPAINRLAMECEARRFFNWTKHHFLGISKSITAEFTCVREVCGILYFDVSDFTELIVCIILLCVAAGDSHFGIRSSAI